MQRYRLSVRRSKTKITNSMYWLKCTINYTDYSKEFQLKQSLLVDYQQWDFPEPCYNSRPRPEDRFPNSKYNKERAKALAKA